MGEARTQHDSIVHLEQDRGLALGQVGNKGVQNSTEMSLFASVTACVKSHHYYQAVCVAHQTGL